MFVYVFAIRKKNKVISSKTLVCSHRDQQQRSIGLFLHYAVADQTELFRLSLVLDWIFGLILQIRPNSGLILKIRPNACCHLKNLCKLGLRLQFALRTKSDLFYQVTQCRNFRSLPLLPRLYRGLYIQCYKLASGSYGQGLFQASVKRCSTTPCHCK